MGKFKQIIIPIILIVIAGPAGFGWIATWTKVAIAVALTVASYLLTPKPKIPSLSGGDGSTKVLLRDSSPPLRWIWGRRRVGGFMIRLATFGQYKNICTGYGVVTVVSPGGTGTRRVCNQYIRRAVQNNASYLYFVAVIAAHPVKAIHQVYVNNELVLFRNFNSTSTDKNDGEIVDRDAVIQYCADNNIRGDAKEQMVNVHNRYRGYMRINARLDGTSEAFPYVNRGGNAQTILSPVKVDLPTEPVIPFYTSVYTGGSEGIDDGGAPPDFWNSKTDRATGMALVYVRLRWDRKIWVNGEPQIEFVVDGKSVYDPRTGRTEYSANGALVLADAIKTLPGIDNRGIDEETLIAAANACDVAPVRKEQANPDGRARDTDFQLNVLAQSTDEAGAVIEQMGKSIGGAVIDGPSGWRIYAGELLPTLHTITDDMVEGSIAINPKTDLQDRVNGLQARYIDSLGAYDWVDTPLVTNPNYVAEDNDTALTKQTDFVYITRIGQASRVLQISLRRERAEETIKLVINDPLIGFELTPYENIRLKLDDINVDGIYKVMRVNQLITEEKMLFELEVRVEDPEAYTFNDDFSNFDVKSYKANLPIYDGAYAPQPINVQVDSSSAQLLIQNDGTVAERMLISWDPASDFRNDTVVNVFKLPVSGAQTINEAIWRDNPQFITQANSVYINSNEADGVHPDSRNYRIIVRHRNWLGAEGSETIVDHVLQGKQDKPNPPISLAAVKQGLAVALTFQVSPLDKDALQAQVIYWQARSQNELPEITTDTLHTGTSIGPYPVAHGQNKEIILPNLNEAYYQFAVRIVDTSGNVSDYRTTTINYELRRDQAEYVLKTGDITDTNLIKVVDGKLIPTDEDATEDKPADTWLLTQYGERPYNTIGSDIGSRNLVYEIVLGPPRPPLPPSRTTRYLLDFRGNLYNGRPITRGTIQTPDHEIYVTTIPDAPLTPASSLQPQWRPTQLRWGRAKVPQAIPYFELRYTPAIELNKMFLIFAAGTRTGGRHHILNTQTAELIEIGTLRWWLPTTSISAVRELSTFSVTAFLPHAEHQVLGTNPDPAPIQTSWIQTKPMPVNNEYAGGADHVRVVISPDVEFVPGVLRRPRPVPADFSLIVAEPSDNDHYYEFWYQPDASSAFVKAEQDGTTYLTGVSRINELKIYRWYVKWYCDRILYNIALRNIDVQFTIREQ